VLTNTQVYRLINSYLLVYQYIIANSNLYKIEMTDDTTSSISSSRGSQNLSFQ